MKIYYKLKTIDPIIVSENCATTNNHQVLDYLPGSAILGVVASKIYSKCSLVEKSWKIFHSGMVKFGPCYPCINNQIALPIPACLFYEKSRGFVKNGKLDENLIENYSKTNRENKINKNCCQCKDGYICPDLSIPNVSVDATTRTAIDSKSKIALDQQLHIYSYINAGQEFIGWIDVTEIKCESIKTDIQQALKQVVRIGRSKNHEFGRVQIKFFSKFENNYKKLESENELVIWCLSDCECLDANGLPTLTPKLDDLIEGVSGSLVKEKTFIKNKKSSFYNSKRASFGTEHQLIEKGSILVYSIDKKLTPAQIKQLENGIGINQQLGFGWIVLDVDWSNFAKNTAKIKTRKKNIEFKSNANNAMIDWINAKHKRDVQLSELTYKANMFTFAFLEKINKVQTKESIEQLRIKSFLSKLEQSLMLQDEIIDVISSQNEFQVLENNLDRIGDLFENLKKDNEEENIKQILKIFLKNLSLYNFDTNKEVKMALDLWNTTKDY